MPRNGHDPMSEPAAFLGAELRRLRQAAGFDSQEALAVALGFDRTVITKAEQGTRPPSDDVLTKWCEACGVDGQMRDLIERLVILARRSDAVPGWFESWLEAERAATMLRIWQPIIIPGLLQTPAYARALFLAGQTDASDDTIDALVRARLARGAIFDRSSPPETLVVLDEVVLHRLIGSPEIMAEQLARVAELSERPYISVQVVPAELGANAALSGAFDIASGDDLPDKIRMEGVEDQTSEQRSLVWQATVIFERVRGSSLPRTLSRDLIREVEQQWQQKQI